MFNIPQNSKNQHKFSHSFVDSGYTEQLCGRSAGVFASPRDSYLTYTDKSPPTPVKNRPDFTKYSLNLYLKTINLYNNDKKVLQSLHHRGFQKFKYINENMIVLYCPSNPSGNSHAGWKLAKNDSNTDKARMASKQCATEKLLANVDVWKYFATFTLDKSKQDRHDFSRSFSHLVKFLQRRHIRYFVVPERHKDGAWHFHALLSQDAGAYLSDFTGKASKALNNPYIKSRLSQGILVQHFPAYFERFGYNTVERILDAERCSFYVTKYVTKTFDDPDFERVSRRRYFTSKGLKSPSIVMPGDVSLHEFEPTSYSKYTEKVYLKRIDVPNWAYSNTQLGVNKDPPPINSHRHREFT